MNMDHILNLTIRVQDFNVVATDPTLLRKLRGLTLHSRSGMNNELNYLEEQVRSRKVDCKILTAFWKMDLVGWALLSQEPSKFTFANSDGYSPDQGILFQVYVNPDFRRKGIGSALIKVAKRKIGKSRLCICPWDYRSESFYNNFNDFGSKAL